MCYETARGTTDSKEKKRLFRGSNCISRELKGRAGVNQVTKGRMENSRQREHHLNGLNDTGEKGYLKN